MKTKMNMIIGAGIIITALFCGCGRHPTNSRSNHPQTASAAAPTEWNDDATKLSPFTKVQYDGGKVLVTYNHSEYELEAINGLSVSDIQNFCQGQYGAGWQKRFAEDLVPVLHDMGHPINSNHTVNLSLIDPAAGQSKDIADAPMTAENRMAVHLSLQAVAK